MFETNPNTVQAQNVRDKRESGRRVRFSGATAVLLAAMLILTVCVSPAAAADTGSSADRASEDIQDDRPGNASDRPVGASDTPGDGRRNRKRV